MRIIMIIKPTLILLNNFKNKKTGANLMTDILKKDKNAESKNNNFQMKKPAGVKIVIIGAVSAGTSAAAKARRFSEEAQIVIYEKYKYISYATCGLPYYVSEKISEPEDLIVTTAAQFEQRFNVKVRVMCEVIKIDPLGKSLTVRDQETGNIFSDNYDKLIIATGTAAISFNQELSALENVFSLRTVDDALQLRKYMDKFIAEKPGAASVVIVGGGYIGLELLEAFLSKGYKVTIIEKASQILPVFDKEIIEYIENYLSGKGVVILKEEEVREIQKDAQGVLTGIVTSKDTVIKADIAVLS